MSKHGCPFCADVAPHKCFVHERTFWNAPGLPFLIVAALVPVALLVVAIMFQVMVP